MIRVISLLLALAAVPPAAESFASDTELYAWPKREISVRVEPGRYGRPADVRAAWDGFRTWNRVRAADANPLLRIVPGGADADVVVTFVPRSRFEGRRVGVTHTSFILPSRRLTKAEIELTAIGTYRGYGPLQAEATAAHEMGHALGISAHSADPDDLMHPANGELLSARDAATLRRAYRDVVR